MAKHRGYSINLSFLNAPSITAQVPVVDQATGEEKIVPLTFVDDEARAIFMMVPHPSPAKDPNKAPDEDKIATGEIDHVSLDTAIQARLDEAAGPPKLLADRLAAADKARLDLKGATDARAAEEAKTVEIKAANAALAARNVELETTLAQLEDQTAAAIVAKNLADGAADTPTPPETTP